MHLSLAGLRHWRSICDIEYLLLEYKQNFKTHFVKSTRTMLYAFEVIASNIQQVLLIFFFRRKKANCNSLMYMYCKPFHFARTLVFLRKWFVAMYDNYRCMLVSKWIQDCFNIGFIPSQYIYLHRVHPVEIWTKSNRHSFNALGVLEYHSYLLTCTPPPLPSITQPSMQYHSNSAVCLTIARSKGTNKDAACIFSLLKMFRFHKRFQYSFSKGMGFEQEIFEP